MKESATGAAGYRAAFLTIAAVGLVLTGLSLLLKRRPDELARLRTTAAPPRRDDAP